MRVKREIKEDPDILERIARIEADIAWLKWIAATELGMLVAIMLALAKIILGGG